MKSCVTRSKIRWPIYDVRVSSRAMGLVVEWEKHHPEANEAALSAFEYDELKSVSKVPRDPRHHSKIDYGRLRDMPGS